MSCKSVKYNQEGKFGLYNNADIGCFCDLILKKKQNHGKIMNFVFFGLL